MWGSSALRRSTNTAMSIPRGSGMMFRLESGQIQPPRIRLNGSGGGQRHCSRLQAFLIMAAHEKKRFSERVDYISSRDIYLEAIRGKNAISRARRARSSRLWVSCGRTRSPKSSISSLLPFLKCRGDQNEHGLGSEDFSNVKTVPEPTEKELQNLREVDETGSLRKKK